MWLHEMAWGGVLLSPLLVFGGISLVMLLVIRFMLRDTRWGCFAWQHGWFDVALFVCLLALVTYLGGTL